MKRVLGLFVGSAAALAVLIALPYVLPEIRVHLVTQILIYLLFAVSLNLLIGYGGMVPFGHGALFGIGAYGLALVLNHFPGTSLLLALVIAALSGLVGAILIGAFCTRFTGVYFTLTSFALQMFLYTVALKWRSVTAGDDGMGVNRPPLSLPGVGSISLRSVENMYYLTLIIVMLGVVACYLFLKTPFGNSLVCVREKETRASFLGYNTFLVKLGAFSLSGLLAGVAGGLYVIYQEFVSTNVIHESVSMTGLLMVSMGGSGHFLGPILGAVFYGILQDWLSSLTKYWMLVMGVVFVLIIMYMRGGLISVFRAGYIRRLFHRGEIDDVDTQNR